MDNYRSLTAAHDQFIIWAKRHGSRFFLDKYALMYFTRRKRDLYKDLVSTVNIKDAGVKVKKIKL